MRRAAVFALLLAVLCFAPGAAAQPKKKAGGDPKPARTSNQNDPKPPADRAKSLAELLERVRSAGSELTAEHKKREAIFREQKEKREQMLEEVRAEEKAESERSEALEKEFEENEELLAEQQDLLKKRLGTTGELFGVVRQVAGDARAQFHNSLTSAQIRGRAAPLDALAQSRELPTIEELEKLWFLLHQEMTESGKVVRFATTVVTAEGETQKQDVIRVGTFNAVAGGKYLQWLPEVGRLAELERQPAERYRKTVAALEAAEEGIVRFAVDPSRGSILSLLVQTPSLRERIELGGVIGYIIMALGAVTCALGLLRLLYMLVIGGLVVLQRREPRRPRLSNPLGRVIDVFLKNRDQDVEVLERKLEEAILKESGKLERFLWAIKVVAVVAPLMGLLGTVTGMIRTFQSITLFGTGDPKLMAGGISEALVTTMLGLIVAIPLVLLHSVLASVSRRIADVLHEQSAGLVASPPDTEQPDAGEGTPGSGEPDITERETPEGAIAPRPAEEGAE